MPPALKNKVKCVQCGEVVLCVRQTESAAERMRKRREALRVHNDKEHGGSRGNEQTI